MRNEKITLPMSYDQGVTILTVRVMREVDMPDFELNEPVMTPIGVGSYLGVIRLHGQRLIVVTFLPEELREVDCRSRGGIALTHSLPEGLVTKIEGAE